MRSLGATPVETSDEEFMRSLGAVPADTAAPSPPPEARTVGGFLGNIPGSAYQLGADIVGAVAHPIETAQVAGKTALGLGAKLTGSETLGRWSEVQPGVNPVDAIVNHLTERYGGLENLKKTAYEDPVGMLSDIATVMSAGGGGVGAGAKVAGLSKVARGAQTVAKVGRVVDPLSVAGRVGGAITKPIGHGAAGALGLTTGVGKEAIKTAARPTPEFLQALRGQTSINQVADRVKGAVQSLRDQRAAQYRQAFDQLPAQQLDVTPLAQTLKDTLDDFGIGLKPVRRPGGGTRLAPDFNPMTSPLVSVGKPAQKEIRDIVDRVLNTPVQIQYPSTPGALSRRGANLGAAGLSAHMDSKVLDAVKRSLDGFYSETSEARALVTRVRKSARDMLSQVPGYDAMTADYQRVTDFLREVEPELSAKASSQKGTMIRKLAYALNQNNDYRQTLLEALDTRAGTRLKDQIAGVALNQWEPRGLARTLAGAGVLYGIGLNFDPSHLLALAAQSPRVVGEITAAGGQLARGTSKPARFARATLRPEVYRPLTMMRSTNPAPSPTPPPE